MLGPVPLTSAYWRRRREFLRGLSLFAASNEAELRVFDRLAGEIWIDRAGDLTREGARGVEFAVIAEGHVVVERGGREIASLGPGDFVGELALLEHRARTATVTATTRVRLLVLGLDEFEVVLREVPSVRIPVEAAAAVRRVGVPVVPAPVLAAAASSTGGGRRRRRTVLFLLACTGVAVVAGGTWLMNERTRATTVDLHDALANFRSATGQASGAVAAVAHEIPGSGAPAVAGPPRLGGGEGPSVAPTPAPGRVGAARVAAPVTTTGIPAAPVAAPPADGVYPYATSGWESISMLGGRHDYPARSYAVVRRTGGCGWEVEHRIIEEHVDHHGRCTSADRFGTTFEGRDIEFFSKRDGLRYQCDVATAHIDLADAPGTVRHATCRSDAGDTMDVTVRREPSEALTIGGTPVDAVCVLLDIVLKGRATGTSTVHFWLHPLSGLILQEHRTTDTQADAVFGHVRYREEATLRLESLTPAR